jgi:hypothetical protein
MKNLRIQVYKSGQDKPEKTVTMPITSLHISMQLLPKQIKATLEKEGIELSQCSELVKVSGIKGTLVELENTNERLVISVE